MSDTQTTNQQEHLVSDWQYPIHKGQTLINKYIYKINANNQEIERVAKDNGIKLDTPMQVFQFFLTNDFAKDMMEKNVKLIGKLKAIEHFAEEVGIDGHFVWGGNEFERL